MGQGRHTLRSVSDPVYPHVLVGVEFRKAQDVSLISSV